MAKIYSDIKARIDAEPGVFGPLSDQEVADYMNNTLVNPVSATISGGQIWNATVFSEFNSLTNANKQEWLAFCGIESVNPFGPAVEFVMDKFDNTTQTFSNLVALRNSLRVTYAVRHGIGKVRVDYVNKARALQ